METSCGMLENRLKISAKRGLTYLRTQLMFIPENFRRRLRAAFPYLMVFSVWIGGNYEIAKVDDIQKDIEFQAKDVFSINEQEAARENAELAKCNWVISPVTQAARDCAVKLVPDLKDWRAARFGALILGGWLAEHPDDLETREVGLKLMDRSWASWYKDYQPAYEKLDNSIRQARDASWFYRFKTNASDDDFERSMYRMTANLDLDIASPEAARRLDARILAHPNSALF